MCTVESHEITVKGHVAGYQVRIARPGQDARIHRCRVLRLASFSRLDFRQERDYKFTLSDVREGGENPPLPRNCDR